MVPIGDVVTLPAAADLAEVLKVIGETQKTRYPVVDGGDVVGMLYLPALFRNHEAVLEGRCDLTEVSVEPLWVEHSLNVGELIDWLQECRQEVALVRGDGGELVGMVTITDAFEYIAGEVEDPGDVDLEDAAQ
jgi:CBS domain containing-hemolysin-like protein